MKTNKFMQFMAAAVVVCGMSVLTSCEKDDYELPEVIESEVYDTGVSSEVTAQSGTEGTKLSYESWIMVKGITRANFDNKVSVTLNNTLNNVTQTVDVVNYEIGIPQTTLVYTIGERHSKDFVTITDSVMVYKVRLENFAIEFPLTYQVGFYDDGITRCQMPYYSYEKITDKGGKLEDMENQTEEGVVYARKLYSHTIAVSCNGKEYTLKASVILRRIIGEEGKPYLVKSELVETGKSTLNDGSYTSWIKVKQTWSTGEEKTEVYERTASLRLAAPAAMEYQVVPTLNITVNTSRLTNMSTQVIDRDDYIYVRENIGEYKIDYYYFALSFDVLCQQVVYDDGILVQELPSYPIDEIKCEAYNLTYAFESTIEGQKCDGYDFTQPVTLVSGAYQQTATVSGMVYLPKQL